MTYDQCDLMARLFIQYLAIYSNDILPKSMKNLPKKAQNFDKYQ